MQLGNHSDVIARAFVDRDNRLCSELKVLTRPKHARIDRPGRLSTCVTVQGCFESELDQWNQAIEGRVPVHVLHLRLEVRDAVFERKTPFDYIRMPLDLDFSCPGDFVDRHASRACACRNRDTSLSSQGERLQE